MPTAGPAADVLGRTAPVAPATEVAPPPPPATAERVPAMQPDENGTPRYKAALLDSLLDLLARLDPEAVGPLRTIDVDDAIAAAREELESRGPFAAGLEPGTGIVVDVLA